MPAILNFASTWIYYIKNLLSDEISAGDGTSGLEFFIDFDDPTEAFEMDMDPINTVQESGS